MYIFKQSISENIWKMKYKSSDDKTIEDTWWRVASFISRNEKDRDKWKSEFYRILYDFKFLPGGRITANSDPNKTKVTLFNCFLSSKIEDSLNSIMDVAKESALVQQQGGGIGFVFSNIRPRGDIIKSSGAEASGPISFMSIYDSICGTIKSAGQRRGAMLGALNIEHPDIYEFIDAKESITFGEGKLSNFNLSIHVTDKFMKAVENNEFFELKFNGKVYKRVKAKELWDKIMKHTYEVAEPGVQFIDTVKKLDNLYFLENNQVEGSNPCVIKGTYVLTKDGYKKVEDIKKGEYIQTLDDSGFEKVDEIEKHDKIMTYKVDFSDGYTIYVTASHMFYILENDTIITKRLDELKPGDKVLLRANNFDYSVLDNLNIEEFERGKEYSYRKILDEHFIDEIYNQDVSFLVGVFVGLVIYHLFVDKIEGKIDVNFKTPNYLIYRYLRMLLLYFGIRSVRTYDIDEYNIGQHIISILSDDYCKLKKFIMLIGEDDDEYKSEFSKILKIKCNNKSFNYNNYVDIISIKPYKEEEVYDLYCKKTDSWITEGIVNRGCGEQFLSYNSACNLGSMNLTKYVKDPFSESSKFDYDSLAKDVKVAIRFLDDVIDLSEFPTEKYEKKVKEERRIGLGITGLGDTLVMMGLRYGSNTDTINFIKSVMKVIRDNAYMESVELAKEKGINKLLESNENRKYYVAGKYIKRLPQQIKDEILKSGIRNTFLLTVAPVGTGSIFANNISSGLEPIFSNMYTRKIRKDDKILDEKVYDYAYLEWLNINGSEKELPSYWVTTNDITIEDHLAILETIQYYVDNSCSKTINVPSDYSFDDFKNVYMDAWKRGIKGVTTYRPNDKVKAVIDTNNNSLKDNAFINDNNKKKLKRDPVLRGVTYKLKAPVDKFSYYITINNFNDEPRPFEIFINTRSNKQPIYSFISRLLSALFRKERNYDFILNEMESTFVNGEGFWYERRYVGSIIAGIGYIIRKHIEDNKPGNNKDVLLPKIIKQDNKPTSFDEQYDICPECGAPTLKSEGGCKTCINCGYSACG